MALDTYDNLQTAIAAWLNRSDQTANIPDFITLAETEIKRRLRRRTVLSVGTLPGPGLVFAGTLATSGDTPISSTSVHLAAGTLTGTSNVGDEIVINNVTYIVQNVVTAAANAVTLEIGPTVSADIPTGTPVTRYSVVQFPLPADCAELRSVRLASASPSLDLPLISCTPEMLAQYRAMNAPIGRPIAFMTLDNGAGQNVLVLTPAPDLIYGIQYTYYQQLTPLSADNETNPDLLESPDLYLYGALMQAEPFLENDDRVQMWKAKFDAAIDQLTIVRDNEEHGASLRPVRLPRVFGARVRR